MAHTTSKHNFKEREAARARRIAAIKAGELYYQGPGKCYRGHLGQRYASNGRCVDCQRSDVDAQHKLFRHLRVVAKRAKTARTLKTLQNGLAELVELAEDCK